MCLAACATAACCCAGELCCSAMCMPFKAFGVEAKHFSKIGYVVFQVFWIVAALSSMFAGTWLMQWSVYIGLECPVESGSGDACFSASGLIRISLVLAIFQLVIFLIVLMRNDAAAVIHDGWWGLKFIVVGCMFAGSMWIPNEPYIVQYMKFSRLVSIVFLSY